MVKIPVGEKVRVNLWDSDKKRGLVKYFTHTMNLVNAESDFRLEKGDTAIVIKSFDSFVVIIPEDKYSKILDVSQKTKVDRIGLSEVVTKILLDWDEKSGGILSIMELLELIHKTSLKYFVNRKDLKNLRKVKDRSYDIIKDSGDLYFVLKPSKTSSDIVNVLKFAQSKDYINFQQLQTKFYWSKLRIERNLDYLVEEKIMRVATNYRSGTRYYLIGKPQL
ncbi:MAG: hypothetical protein GF364_14055 [Candidatus Lokiarchaeota archaeon]|nr:hypothetical protein [Candidatus Lokiarchaeota archaeon]